MIIIITYATLPNSSLGTSFSLPADDSFALNAATRAAISSFGNLRNQTRDTLITHIKIILIYFNLF